MGCSNKTPLQYKNDGAAQDPPLGMRTRITPRRVPDHGGTRTYSINNLSKVPWPPRLDLRFHIDRPS